MFVVKFSLYRQINVFVVFLLQKRLTLHRGYRMDVYVENSRQIEAMRKLIADMERVSAEAEASSRFKRGQRVRVCQTPGLSFVGGIHHLPHDHNDPKQHWDSRVVGWNSFGEIEIAIPYGDNPHSCEWPYGEDCLTLIDEGKDWVEKSNFKPHMKVCYEWDLTGFGEDARLGVTTPAIILTPHIEVGDWIVSYPKLDGMWITRVLNEKQMGTVIDH